MKKEITMVKEGNTKKLNVTTLEVLSESESEKLNSKNLIQRIDNLAKDLHISWAVRETGNVHMLEASRICENGVVDDTFMHQLEIDVTNFMSAIVKMELEKKCPSHEEDPEEDDKRQTRLDVIKEIVKDIDEGDEIIALVGTVIGPLFVGNGNISTDLLRDMCNAYIQLHE